MFSYYSVHQAGIALVEVEKMVDKLLLNCSLKDLELVKKINHYEHSTAWLVNVDSDNYGGEANQQSSGCRLQHKIDVTHLSKVHVQSIRQCSCSGKKRLMELLCKALLGDDLLSDKFQHSTQGGQKW